MSLLRRVDVFGRDLRESFIKTADVNEELLKEAAAPLDTRYDVFLSHSYRDSREVWKLRRFLAGFNLRVYVDWLVEDDLSRDTVTPETANRLKARIANSRCLLVFPTAPAQRSRWMPWELGIADGMGKRVGIIPVVEDTVLTNHYAGNEYLGLYNYIDCAPCKGERKRCLWANANSDVYVRFDFWLDGEDPSRQS